MYDLIPIVTVTADQLTMLIEQAVSKALKA